MNKLLFVENAIKRGSLLLVLLACTLMGFAREQCSVDSAMIHLSLEQKIKLMLIPLPSGELIKEDAKDEEGWTFTSGVDDFDSTTGFRWPLLDVRNGFLISSLQLPFPDDRALSSLKSQEDRDFLKSALLYHLAKNGLVGVLASTNYLFHPLSADTVVERGFDGDQLSVWVFNSADNQPLSIPVSSMPSELFAYHQSVFSQNEMIEPLEKILAWNPSVGSLTAEFSFEKRVQYGHLFLTSNYKRDLRRLLRAYESKWLNEEDLNKGCRKILEIMCRVGAVPKPPERPKVIYTDLVSRRAFEGGIQLFQPAQGPFPLTDLTQLSLAVVAEDDMSARSDFIEMVTRYHSLSDDPEKVNLVFWLVDRDRVTSEFVQERVAGIRQKFKNARVVMFWTGSWSNFHVPEFPESLDALLVGTSNWPYVWKCLAESAFSAVEIKIDPYDAPKSASWTSVARHLSVTRLKYGVPLEIGMHPDSLMQIDDIVQEGISEKAMPGARVLVACRGVVVWDRAYGWHTYKKSQPVRKEDLYDLASVTKVTATLPSLMKLYDEGKWALTDTLSKFISETDTTDKRKIRIRDLLLHESGLPSFIPFYLNTIDREKLRGHLFSRRYSSLYSVKLDNRIYLNRTVSYRSDVFNNQKDTLFSISVCQNRYMNYHYLDSMKQQIFAAPLRTDHKYLYSDLGFMLLGEMVNRISKSQLNDYVSENFFAPLGAQTTLFLPLTRFLPERVVPTEQDNAFRKQLLRGWVHDPGAAMMGGVAGHAGLFSDAGDLAKLMQMLLNKGAYGGIQFIKPETVELFTQSFHEENRRGLGFDKPNLSDPAKSPASKYASEQSFGHTGFTGTMVWIDPAQDLVFVFLSNRVHPRQYNKKLIEMNIRTRIQDVIYKSFIMKETPKFGKKVID